MPQKKQTKPNYWKIATIVLAIIFLFLVIMDFIYQRSYYTFNGELKIKKVDLENMFKASGQDSLVLCETKQDGKCFKVWRTGE